MTREQKLLHIQAWHAAMTRADDAIQPVIDALKLRSSVTLFARADPGEPVFGQVLDRFYAGRPDPATEELLS